MAGEIHQDVDPVGADRRRQLVVANTDGRAPDVGAAPMVRGDAVFPSMPVVAVDGKISPVVIVEHRSQEQADRMRAQIGRHIADFEALFRVAQICVSRPRYIRQPCAIGLMFHQQRIQRHRWIVLQAKQVIAVISRLLRRQFGGAPEPVYSVLRFALIFQYVGEVVVSRDIARLQRNRALIARQRCR